ncbi:hypothetical protein AYI68_g7798 [Smittium mucronatum]|uniref:Uncharacterized protein n=1 Tax=Smittium mucronatum TaxID=133383 RepID=A0A1R0GMP6_9FUNG|nr:hypothetical protein AYI68_g7798 [Smittium mucronatum]
MYKYFSFIGLIVSGTCTFDTRGHILLRFDISFGNSPLLSSIHASNMSRYFFLNLSPPYPLNSQLRSFNHVSLSPIIFGSLTAKAGFLYMSDLSVWARELPSIILVFCGGPGLTRMIFTEHRSIPSFAISLLSSSNGTKPTFS